MAAAVKSELNFMMIFFGFWRESSLVGHRNFVDSIKYMPTIGKRANTPWNVLNTGRKDSENLRRGHHLGEVNPKHIDGRQPKKILTLNDLNTLELS